MTEEVGIRDNTTITRSIDMANILSVLLLHCSLFYTIIRRKENKKNVADEKTVPIVEIFYNRLTDYLLDMVLIKILKY